MGALTSNRKRGDEYLSLNPGIPSLNSPNSNFQTSAKRARFLSPSMNPTPITSKSAISRLSRYPDAKPPLPRLHAPCANLRFGANPRPNRRPSFERESVISDADEVMGNFLSSNYFRLKKTALSACRYLRGEKNVRDFDLEDIVVVGASSEEEDDDSGVEEIVVVEDDIELGDGNVGRGNGDSDARMEDRAETSASMLRSQLSGLELEPGISSVSVYKKLIRAVEERTPRLKELGFEIEVNELRRSFFTSLRPVKKLVEVIPREPFIPLTKNEETEVKRAFSANRRKVLVAHENSNIEITGQVLQCLRPGAWLNDEVINVYLELLKEREKRDPKSFLKCHFFNTFFYKKLIGGGYNYKSVKRWTTQRKLGYSLADCDKIFVPVHKEIHWCLAVIDKKEEKFQYLDSLGGRDNQVMKALERYFADEVRDKCGKEINLSSWRHEFVEDLPEQQNGFDCGVFMIKYADFYSRGSRLCFSQEHMPYFRLRTAKEILRLRAE